MMACREAAPAKINLSLHVGRAGKDGFHPLDSLVVFTDFADHIVAAPADELTLTITGPFARGLAADKDNLVLRAAQALQKYAKVVCGAHLALEKNIPVAAGLGGGSADAAATLRALNQLWDCQLDLPTLEAIGAGLGADVPVCVRSQPARMRGRGERLDNITTWPGLYGVLVNPGFALSTAHVFAQFDTLGGADEIPRKAVPDAAVKVGEAALAALADFDNALTPAAIACAPRIGALLDVLTRLPHVRLARLCGSGASCFALCDTMHDAEALAKELLATDAGLWCVPVRFVGTGEMI